MREGTATLIRREDYTAPAYWIKTVDLTFDLDPVKTLVINRMQVERNTALPVQPLKLHGEDIMLTRVLVNNESVLLMCWPPAPLARKVSVRTSDGLMSISIVSSTSG